MHAQAVVARRSRSVRLAVQCKATTPKKILMMGELGVEGRAKAAAVNQHSWTLKLAWLGSREQGVSGVFKLA
jgi:hypothetical protein